MPLAITKILPDPAFSVQYQGETITIYHAYEDDIVGLECSNVYTADEAEGVREGQRLAGGLMGSKFGYTEDEDRNDFFFDTHMLYRTMTANFVSEFQHPKKKYASDWDDKFIVQTAINYGLIGFDEDFRFVETQRISHSIKSCTGGEIRPYEVKVVSHG
tara:strand:+ start:425 stop:901 length:477 start_codon:yes stop_codon:yes gene_type:complete